ncbi:MAG: helical backbone metal receptor [Myxococcota bacterium]
MGRAVRLKGPRPQRIVSLVPSQTELLAELGLDDEVVGLTRYCIHPTDWKARKAIVGGTKKARMERVADLNPDLILANKEENTRDDVMRLETLAPVYVTDVAELEGALTMIRAVGQLVGRALEAETLAHQIEERFERLPRVESPLRALYLIWRNPWMTVGQDTFIHDMMTRVGLVNVYGAQMRYPKTTVEEMQALRPDVVLLSSEPYPFKEADVEALQEVFPEAKSVRLVDGELFSWYGSRILRTPKYLEELRAELDGA